MKEKDWGSLKLGKFQIKTQTLIFVLGLAGIVLIGLSPMLSRAKVNQTPAPSAGEKSSAAEYAQDLESKLKEILSQVNGVGQVRVMVTLKNGYSYEYAKSAKVNNDVLEDIKAEDTKKTQEKHFLCR